MSNYDNGTMHTSELRQNVTIERFKAAFEAFLEQAEQNAVSKRAHGGKKPFGFANTHFDGADFHTHFGQGGASKAPYINWWALSIYYIVEAKCIVMGIEKDRYPHLNKLEFSRYKEVPGKADVAVFYATTKDNVDYEVMYDKFITIAEEIMALGLE